MIDYGSVCSGIENADERPGLRCGCGYEFADELGEYGCPNCEGDEGPAEHVPVRQMGAESASQAHQINQARPDGDTAMRTITALHTLQDGQAVTNLGNLPGPDDCLTKAELLDMARQIHQHAIDAQRITETPVRHPATPAFLEYPEPPTFEESCDMHPSMMRGSHE